MQLFALYNHTDELNHSPRFYSLRVPLQVQREAGLITEVHTHWLDYMTQHFTSGAQLVDGFFHLGDYNGKFRGVGTDPEPCARSSKLTFYFIFRLKRDKTLAELDESSKNSHSVSLFRRSVMDHIRGAIRPKSTA